MVETKEKDEVSELNLSLEKDAAQTANSEKAEMSNNEGKPMVTVDNVDLKIDEKRNNEKAVAEEKTDNEDAVKENAIGGTDQEKAEGQKNKEKSGVVPKGKGKKARKRMKKRLAQKGLEMVGSGSTGNVEKAEEANNEGKHMVTEEANHEGKNMVTKETKDEGKNMVTQETNDEGKNMVTEEANNEGKKMVTEEANDGGKKMVPANDVELKSDEKHGDGKVMAEEKADKEDAAKEDTIEGEDEKKTEGQKNGEKSVEISKGKGRKPGKMKKKKAAQKNSEMVAVNGDKPESSKKNSSKKAETMGMVFMCTSKTKTDCFRYKILGLPASKKDQVAKIYKGMRLFLFDVDLRLMYGIFKAAGPGGYNIEPKAFKSGFPSQVRFTVIDDCLPLAEEKFKKVIKENYYSRNKFECLLNAEQVKKLCKLFVSPGKGGPSPQTTIKMRRSGADENRRRGADGGHKRGADENRRGGDREKRRRRALEEERRPHSSSGARRRYREYEQPPVIYEREAFPSGVDHVPRYQPLAPPSLAPPVRSYGYERAVEMHPYVRSPVSERRTFRVLDTEPRRYDEIVSRERDQDRDPYLLYSREPHSYRDTLYPPVGQAPEYHHPPPQYRLVSREYNPSPAVQPAEYRLSSGLTSEYRASAASLPEYRSHHTHYRY